jgi:hypothetical protein
MRTFNEASATEEEDQRQRRSRGDSTEDGAVDVRWSLSPSRRGRLACCSAQFLRREIKRDPHSARN